MTKPNDFIWLLPKEAEKAFTYKDYVKLEHSSKFWEVDPKIRQSCVAYLCDACDGGRIFSVIHPMHAGLFLFTDTLPTPDRSPPPDEVFQRVIHYLGVPALAKYIAELEKEVTRAQAAYSQEREKRLHVQQSLAHTQRALQETLQQLNDLGGKKERERLARERARTAAKKIDHT
ncbi:hypothetical protein ACDT20_13855 [Staphylococcus aureus]